MEWAPELSVGVKEIDDQHKKLVEIINKANEISLEKEKGSKVLNELIEFVRVHFGTEEKYFKQTNYLGSEEHILEHARLIEKVLEFKTKHEEGKCPCDEFLKFLKKWVENHLKIMDRKYVETFKEYGLK